MKTSRNVFTAITVVAVAIVFLASAAYAVPQTINYQGYLEGSGGAPVNGTVNMTFKIYNVSTGGAALWTEVQSSVTVTEGAFSAVLGSVTPIDLPFDSQYYLGVTVGGDGEMTPRAVLVSVPYAFRAKEADSLASNLLDTLDSRYSIPPVTIAVDTTYIDGWYTSTALGLDGLPVIAYRSSSDQSLKVAKCGNSFCSTSTITTVDATADVGEYTSIAVPTDGNPVISYFDKTNADLKVAKCGNPSCSSGNTINTVASTDNNGSYYSSIVTIGNLPRIAYYYAGTNGELRVLACADASCTPATNTINVVDATVQNVGMYPSMAQMNSAMYIAYFESTNADLKVAMCYDYDCSGAINIETVDSTGDVGRYASITKGANGYPLISYKDGTNQDLKVLKCGDSLCSPASNTITTVEASGAVGDVGNYSDIAIGIDGLPVIAYSSSKYHLAFAHCGDDACSSGNTISSAAPGGSYISMVVPADGLPFIAYYGGAADLMTAKCQNYIRCGASGLQ